MGSDDKQSKLTCLKICLSYLNLYPNQISLEEKVHPIILEASILLRCLLGDCALGRERFERIQDKSGLSVEDEFFLEPMAHKMNIDGDT